MAETKPAKASVFETLAAINCNEHIEKKSNGKVELSYLSWAWAWHYVKSHYPDAFYTIYEREDGIPYWTDGKTAWVKTGVTIEGIEHIEYLPIMDYKNASIPLGQITSMDMNKAIQRSLTKAAARHGLGLYIYAGEDLPLSEEEAKAQEAAAKGQGTQPVGTQRAQNRRTSTKQLKLSDLTPEKYAVWVEGAARGKTAKSGIPVRDAFIATFHPTPQELDDYDMAIMNFRIDNNVPGTQPAAPAQQ